uniref:ATP synthase subunit a n=1 Tax=Thylacodes squamigerus TaxID=766170 RepID=E2FLU6_9CAEN|nr:ATP synthase F0 subunit 6 [Thylacodes squamigerus]ADI79412.1 ATP synthase F0 subunit 6 [Thylacodes squamigerus]
MLVDIFSCFDDNNMVFLSMYSMMWVLSVSGLSLLGFLFTPSSARSKQVFNMPNGIMFSQVERTFGSQLGGFYLVMGGLFMFLILVNLCGLIPYVFSASSHLALSLALGLPFWLLLLISGTVYNPKSTVAALLPMGAPAPLNPFLVLIETVSLLVRPLTLSVRLTANMSAGHIVLGLVGNFLTFAALSSPLSANTVVLLSIQVFYTIFEFAICVIQAYIFCLLITLYSDEHSK